MDIDDTGMKHWSDPKWTKMRPEWSLVATRRRIGGAKMPCGGTRMHGRIVRMDVDDAGTEDGDVELFRDSIGMSMISFEWSV